MTCTLLLDPQQYTDNKAIMGSLVSCLPSTKKITHECEKKNLIRFKMTTMKILCPVCVFAVLSFISNFSLILFLSLISCAYNKLLQKYLNTHYAYTCSYTPMIYKHWFFFTHVIKHFLKICKMLKIN